MLTILTHRSMATVNVPNDTYHTRLIGSQVLDDKATKIYFVDYPERRSEEYRWQNNERQQDLLVRKVMHKASECPAKIPHIAVASPKIARIYRFGSPLITRENENCLYLLGKWYYDPENHKMHFFAPDSEALDLGCGIESTILSTEMHFWNNSKTVGEYMAQRVPTNISVIPGESNKLRRFVDTELQVKKDLSNVFEFPHAGR
jgi:hypothetical protein